MLRFGLSLLLVMTYVLAHVICGAKAEAENVKLKNNSYSGIVIAINPEIPENMSILAQIMSVWGETSQVLYKATRKRAYFGEITILVPKSWNSSTYDRAVFETYGKADVIIAPPNRVHRNRPYTVQTGGCGVPGTHIHLTPEYLVGEKYVEDFGPKSKTIVHEWAHLRWGVFDEVSEDQPFYLSAGGVEFTRCPQSLEGEYLQPNYDTGEVLECVYDPVTSLPNASCQFFLYEDQQSGLDVSLMSHYSPENVEFFCHNDTNDPVNLHNSDAPNEQNRLCNRRSVWDVMMDSPDFAGDNNPPNPNITNVRPIFRLVKPFPFRRYVIVLDTSGSMRGDRMSSMRLAVSHFINIFMEAGDHLGIVSFSSFARQRSQLKAIETDKDREDMSNHIPKRARGATCIGCGINAALSVMEKSSPDACGDIIVFTDGEETQAPHVADVIDKVINKKCRLNAIFFANHGNAALESLVKQTRGRWFFANAADLSNLIGAFGELASNDDGDVKKQTAEVHSSSKIVEAGAAFSNDVIIDRTIGNYTKFAFSWSQGDAPDVTLTSPHRCSYTTVENFNGKTCDDNPIHDVNDRIKIISFAIPGTAKPGTWHYNVSPTTTQTITITVSSKLSGKNNNPIVVKSGSKKDPNIPGCTVVYARVTVGGVPLTGLNVLAKIAKPDASEVKLDLHDKGAAPDTKANDGVYTRCFNGANVRGRYSMRIEVTGKNVEENNESFDSLANFIPGYIKRNGTVVLNINGEENKPRPPTEEESTVDSSYIGSFSRVSASEGFSAEGITVDPDLDDLPPSAVTDLKAEQKNLTDPEAGIYLKFLAPGDDYDSGNASSYVIRYAINDGVARLLSMGEGNLIGDLDIIEGDLGSPQEAGNEETFLVRVSDVSASQEPTKIGFMIRAVDERGNEGAPSNIAILNLLTAPPPVPTLPPIVKLPPPRTTPSPTSPPTTSRLTTSTRAMPVPVLKMKQTFHCQNLYWSAYIAAHKTACRYHAGSARWYGCVAARRQLISMDPNYKSTCGDVDYVTACREGYNYACRKRSCHTCYSRAYKPHYSLYSNRHWGGK